VLIFDVRLMMHEPPEVFLAEISIVPRKEKERVPAVVDLRRRTQPRGRVRGAYVEELLGVGEKLLSGGRRKTKVLLDPLDHTPILVAHNLVEVDLRTGGVSRKNSFVSAHGRLLF
jgi:hypothetical protein